MAVEGREDFASRWGGCGIDRAEGVVERSSLPTMTTAIPGRVTPRTNTADVKVPSHAHMKRTVLTVFAEIKCRAVRSTVAAIVPHDRSSSNEAAEVY